MIKYQDKQNNLSGILTSFWPLFYLTVIAGLLFALFSNWSYDDPYITYRYAYNLRNGLGFVYNANERVLSTSTPLFTLILTAANFFSGNIPAISILIGAISLSSSALFIWKLAIIKRLPIVGGTFVF